MCFFGKQVSGNYQASCLSAVNHELAFHETSLAELDKKFSKQRTDVFRLFASAQKAHGHPMSFTEMRHFVRNVFRVCSDLRLTLRFLAQFVILCHLGLRHQKVQNLVWENVDNLENTENFIKITLPDGNKTSRETIYCYLPVVPGFFDFRFWLLMLRNCDQANFNCPFVFVNHVTGKRYKAKEWKTDFYSLVNMTLCYFNPERKAFTPHNFKHYLAMFLASRLNAPEGLKALLLHHNIPKSKTYSATGSIYATAFLDTSLYCEMIREFVKKNPFWKQTWLNSNSTLKALYQQSQSLQN